MLYSGKALFSENTQGLPAPPPELTHTLVLWPHYTSSGRQRKDFLLNLSVQTPLFSPLSNFPPNFAAEFCIVFLLNRIHFKYTFREISTTCVSTAHICLNSLNYIKICKVFTIRMESIFLPRVSLLRCPCPPGFSISCFPPHRKEPPCRLHSGSQNP